MDAIRASAAITTFVIVAVLSAGCQAVTPAAEPVELTLAHIDGGPELDPAVDWYAERVAELSDGELTIDVRRSCCGDEADVEERLVDRVASGEADLGWVGTRALTELGVAELSALTAPMLLDDYALQRAALESDAAIAALMPVDELGVEGIALVPGAVRHPLASGSALISAADWTGVTVASFRSAQQAEAFTALGAEPLDVSFEERDMGLFDGSIRAIENSLPFLDHSFEQIVPFATVNVGLWPRVSAVIGNPSSMERLADDQTAILRQAGADVAAMTPDLRALDEQAIASSCASGAIMVEAPEDALEGLRAAFTPVIERLREDERAAPLLAVIEELRAGSESQAGFDLPEACGESPTSADDEQATGDPAALNGAYRSPELTVEIAHRGRHHL